jgi:hypothetical protein
MERRFLHDPDWSNDGYVLRVLFHAGRDGGLAKRKVRTIENAAPRVRDCDQV